MNTLTGEVLILPKMSGSVSTPKLLSGNVGAKTINVGGKGDDGATFTPSVSADGIISWTNDRDLPNPTPVNIMGPAGADGAKGDKGDKGDTGPQGPQGDKGDPGAPGTNGKDGAPGKDGANGKDGSPGKDGADGISPVVAVEDIDGGHRVTITDKDGEKTFDVMDGEDGAVTEEQIASAVEDYMAEHPVEVTGIVKTVNGISPDENGNVEIPVSGGNVDLTGYATEQYVKDYAQPKGNYLTEVPSGYATEEFVKNKIAEAELGGEEVDLSGYAQKSELPTKVSQLQNDSGFLTEISKEEIVQQVIAALGTPVFGRVDAENNIVLSGALADGTYTIKYEDAEGNQTEIGTIEVTGEVSYTNLADPTSEDWAVDKRLNSSAALVDATGCHTTNFFPCVKGDVIRVKGLDIRYTNSEHTQNARAFFYNENNSHIVATYPVSEPKIAFDGIDTFTITLDGLTNISGGSEEDVAKGRFSGMLFDGYTSEDVIITVNQEITG